MIDLHSADVCEGVAWLFNIARGSTDIQLGICSGQTTRGGRWTDQFLALL